MRSALTLISAAALLELIVLAPGRAEAQAAPTDPIAVRKAQDEFARLQENLARVNAEIADLKRSDRSVRNDYRLRDRMAEAEALAQKLNRAEARLRAVKQRNPALPGEAPMVTPPPASPQDGSLELEAKADLFADQARKLEDQADALAKAAVELSARKALRRRAGAWDRDPFAGLESSKRSLAVQAAKPTDPRGDLPTGTSTPTSGASVPAASGATYDSAGKSATTAGTPESTASKSSPLALGGSPDHQLEQRLYLDPTTAAGLRQALGAAGSGDPDALTRAANALRARARSLSAQAETLRRKSRTP